MMNLLKSLFSTTSVNQYNAVEFEQIRKSDPNAVVIDVRTDREVREHQIPGAVHINLQSRLFDNEISKLDKDKKYLVYCRSGRRSLMACKMMLNQGIKDCNNLSGGIMSWDLISKNPN